MEQKKSAAFPWGRTILRYIMPAALTIQIGFGLIWTIGNLTGFQEYASAYKRFGMFTPKGRPILYLPQLILAFCANRYLMKRLAGFLERKLPITFGALVLLTIPQCLQCHLALTGHSWLIMAGTVIIGYYLKSCTREEVFIPTMRRRKYLGPYLIALGVLLMLVCYFSGRYGSFEKRLATNMASRFAWPHFKAELEYLPQDMAEKLDPLYVKISDQTDGLSLYLVPELKRIYGPLGVTPALWTIANTGRKVYAGVNVKNIVWDELGYHFAPVVVPLQLRGRGYDALTGTNYDAWRKEMPVFSKIYLEYETALFLGILFCVLLAMCINLRTQSLKSRCKVLLPLILFLELPVTALVFKGAGLMDYRNCALVTIGWYLYAFSVILPQGDR